ncbi:MAG: hypothetical protein Q7T89_09925, partial [Anaerolineales bacterium]|nr:hypothetical protein [Anaerolineales bacterium]
ASDEELDAFILTYRFFIQNNEAISFNRIAEIYNNLSINKLYRDCFQAARNELHRFINSSNELGIKLNKKKLSNGEILDTYIYGELAHTNPDKRKKFKEWTRDEATTNLLKASLFFSLIEILNTILYVMVLNEGAIKDLSAQPNNLHI